MKRTIKSLIIAAFVLFGAESLFASDATVTFIKGKVEVLKGNEWVALNIGDELKKSDVVNTGFQSEAKIKLFDSVMYLGPVTRIALEELSTNQSQDKVNVYLKTGNVRSQVNHTESKRVSYQVRTAIAVASVRGTNFEMDDSSNIFCNSGSVATAPIRALTEEADTDMGESAEVPDDGVIVQANQSMTVTEDNYTATPVNQVVQAAAEVVSTVAKASEKEAVSTATAVSTNDVVAVAAAPVEPQTGNLIIKVTIDNE